MRIRKINFRVKIVSYPCPVTPFKLRELYRCWRLYLVSSRQLYLHAMPQTKQ